MRKKTSHKGENGRVLVIAGSKDYSGAVYLTASSVAALRCGSDLVTVACPEKVAWSINSLNPDIITYKLKGNFISKINDNKIQKLIEKNDIILIGPGISENKSTASYIRSLIKNIKKPKVIDADALKSINLKNISNSVLTPHHKEFEILLKNSNLKENNFKKYLNNNIILLKGKEDKIISKDKIYKNTNGNSGMTVGGTGDILAGLVAGYLSQNNSLLSSARKAANLNGNIGDKLKKELGNGFIASDFLKIIAKEANK